MKKFIAAMLLSVGVASAANAAIYQYDVSNPAQNNSAGNVSSIHSTFDSSADAFTWNVTYSNGASKDTDGYWLVVSDGPNPKGSAGQLAIVYFDASNINAPKVSVYRYNGLNSQDSFVSPGDMIASNQLAGSGIVASASQSGGQRTFNLSIDASTIDSIYNAGNGFPDWEGIQYGDKIGVWFHSVSSLSTTYKSTSKKLSEFNFCNQGWIDTANECTTRVPAPTGAGVLALSGLVAARRRRKA